MASLSKISIIGNVGRDPEMKMTPTGKAVCEFSVAVNRGRGEDQQTDWYRVACWGKLGDNAQQYVSKGRLVFVEGRFEPREWTGKEGDKHTSLEISANDFQLLDKRDMVADTDAAGEPRTTRATYTPPVGTASGTLDPDEIPF